MSQLLHLLNRPNKSDQRLTFFSSPIQWDSIQKRTETLRKNNWDIPKIFENVAIIKGSRSVPIGTGGLKLQGLFPHTEKVTVLSVTLSIFRRKR